MSRKRKLSSEDEQHIFHLLAGWVMQDEDNRGKKERERE